MRGLSRGGINSVGERIRKARHERGLTQEELAEPRFTKAYVSALERGAVRPSLKALEFLAERLGMPIVELLEAKQDVKVAPALQAIEEDLRYQIDYAKMLIRTNKVDEAFRLITAAEEQAQPYWEELGKHVRYLIPFTRARGHLQMSQASLAQPELEAALELAKGDDLATARIRNLVGVVFFELGKAHLALEEHLQCLHAIHNKVVKDPSLCLSIFRNLANDYWALNNSALAISAYKEALTILTDLDDLGRQAGLYWALALAYRAENDWAHAKLYAVRALNIYEAADERAEAATISIDLAELLIGEARYDEAEQLLERAKEFLAGNSHPGLWSLLYRCYAALGHKQGHLQLAADYAAESVNRAEELLQVVNADPESSIISTGSAESGQPWIDATRNYAAALHMSALIYEALGQRDSADQSFLKAIGEIEPTDFEETKHAINFSYAEVLSTRGAYEQAMGYYKAAAQSHQSRIHTRQ